MEQMVRVYRPEARWLTVVASRWDRAARERAFRLVLEGKLADTIPLEEARRQRV
jgi:hypothetical protein